MAGSIQFFSPGERAAGPADGLLDAGEALCSAESAPSCVTERQAFEGLARTIEADIIPRLMLSHSTLERPPSLLDQGAQPTREDLDAFSTILLRRELTDCLAFAEQMRLKGASLETLFLRLLAPSARRLGEMWEADLCSFVDVTIGLCRLQQVLRKLRPDHAARAETSASGRRVFLAPAPGDQHTFGLFMVEELFRRDGWDVCCSLPEQSEDGFCEIRDEWFEVIGFSLSCEKFLDRLTETIAVARRDSMNENIAVMVGGPFFTCNPQLCASVGADATAMDGIQAVEIAAAIVKRR